VFNSLALTAAAGYLAHHADAANLPATMVDATIAGNRAVFWAAAAVFLTGAVVAAMLFRSGPLPINRPGDPG